MPSDGRARTARVDGDCREGDAMKLRAKPKKRKRVEVCGHASYSTVGQLSSVVSCVCRNCGHRWKECA